MIHGGSDFKATIFVLSFGGELEESVKTQEIEQEINMSGTWSINGSLSINLTNVNPAETSSGKSRSAQGESEGCYHVAKT